MRQCVVAVEIESVKTSMERSWGTRSSITYFVMSANSIRYGRFFPGDGYFEVRGK